MFLSASVGRTAMSTANNRYCLVFPVRTSKQASKNWIISIDFDTEPEWDEFDVGTVPWQLWPVTIFPWAQG